MPDFIVFKADKSSPPPYQGGVRGGLKDLCAHRSFIQGERSQGQRELGLGFGWRLLQLFPCPA
jgi:hypothetical protein